MKLRIVCSILITVLVLAACTSSAPAEPTAEPAATSAPAEEPTEEPAAEEEAAEEEAAEEEATEEEAAEEEGAEAEGAAEEVSGPATVMVAENAELGEILVDAAGMTLYMFTNDEANVTNCYDSCAQNWPPLLTEGDPVAGEGVDASLLGTTERTDGTTQVTYNGWPLYYFAQDQAPGDVVGQGRGDVWYVLSPAGEIIGMEGAEEGATEEEAAEDEAAEVDSSTVLTAIRVDEVSLDADAPYWADAPALSLSTVALLDDLPDGPVVTIQAAYDDNNLAIRAEWADETESLLKDAWTWDGTTFTRGGESDQLNFSWPINQTPEFAERGCGILCHEVTVNGQQRNRMGAPDEDHPFDTWTWKSARTNPLGQADDLHWQVLTETASGLLGRVPDEGEGGYAPNANETNDAPLYMHSTDLTAPFIMGGEETEVTPDTLEPGTVIPGYILTPLTGSRGDISATGSWADGRWTVVIMRAFDTGNEWDVVLSPGTPQNFGMSVHHEGRGAQHKAVPVPLTLEWAE